MKDQDFLTQALVRIEDKIDRIEERTSSIDVTLGVQAEQLKNHMARTAANEEQLVLFREELKPISNHVAFFSASAKLITVVATLLGIWQIFK